MSGRNTSRHAIAALILGLAVIFSLCVCQKVNAQPLGYRVQCNSQGTGCRLVRITAPASARRFLPLRRDGRRFSTRSEGMRPVQKALSRAGRLFRKGK